MNKSVWTILKLLAMLFVILSCISFIHNMALVGSITGNYGLLGIMVVVDAGFVYWAYRVI